MASNNIFYIVTENSEMYADAVELHQIDQLGPLDSDNGQLGLNIQFPPSWELPELSVRCGPESAFWLCTTRLSVLRVENHRSLCLY